MKEVDLIENPQMGTSGLSSAMQQLFESTSAFTLHFGTVSSPILIAIPDNKPERERPETFKDTLKKVIKKHRESLDALGDP